MLAAAAAAIGAGSVFAVKTVLPQQAASMAASVRALGERAATFRLSDLNPIRSIYEGVKSKITSSNPGEGYNLKFSSTLPFTFSGPIKLPAPIEIDQRAVNRAIAAGINAQVKQNYQRSQAMIQYGRNPIAWHGAPPH